MTSTPKAGLTARSPARVTDHPRDGECGPWIEYLSTANDACSSVTWHEHRIAIASCIIYVRFSCDELREKIWPALAHLEVATQAAPELILHIVDSTRSRVHLPAPPFASWVAAKGQLVETHGDQIFAAYEMPSEGLSVLDRSAGVGFFHVPDALRIPSFETAFPVRTLLNAWLGGRGLQLVHSGAVGTEHGGVLLTGRGGSGKSNTCLACLDAGFLYAGDDYVVAGSGPDPRVHGIYNSAKLHAADVGRFPNLARALAHASTRDDEKSVLFLQRTMPSACARDLPIRAILLPRVTGQRDTRIVPASRAESLKAMAPSTVFQLAGAGRGEFQAMARLAAHVPSFALELGTDRAQIPGIIREFLATRVPEPVT